jgi:hypothetical protein
MSVSCTKTQTRVITTNPPPCVLPEWPALPEVYLLKECPEGVVCISPADRERLSNWINQVIRVYQKASKCPGLEFRELLDPNQGKA